MSTFCIGNRQIGLDEETFIIAEISANHNQSYEAAADLVQIAKDVGADAVKLQTYTPDTITIDSDKDWFRISTGTLWDGTTLHELYRQAYTPWEWQPRLKAIADKIGIALFSSPFDPTAVDFLEEMDIPAYKIASFELVDIPLIRKVAATGKPMIMSTGMATIGEIDEAVRAAKEGGCQELALLKCTSAYPAPPAEANLATIPHLAKVFDVVAGLSDHTLGIAVPVAAVAVGARIIEKHFTLSRAVEGPDSAFSLEPDEFRDMVNAVRIAEQAIGSVRYERTETEERSMVFRRSLFAVENIKAGEKLTSTNVRSIRPGNGLPPKFIDQIIGRTAMIHISKGTPLRWEFIG